MKINRSGESRGDIPNRRVAARLKEQGQIKESSWLANNKKLWQGSIDNVRGNMQKDRYAGRDKLVSQRGNKTRQERKEEKENEETRRKMKMKHTVEAR
jgi:hypothetical protein